MGFKAVYRLSQI